MKVIEGNFGGDDNDFEQDMEKLQNALDQAKKEDYDFIDYAFVASTPDGKVIFASNALPQEIIFMLEVYKNFIIKQATE